MSSVNLAHITKVFGNVTAVRELNLQIKEGEFFTFLGPSGCGKTTTLRMIAGFYYPTAGKVLFNDKNMTSVPPERRNTGMVFQNYALFPHMTVSENVAFGLKVRKVDKATILKKVEVVLTKVQLAPYWNRQVSQLSGGQQQRVALARALVIEPDILLLDEPLSNLDARLRDEMRTEIIRLQKEYGITTIYVTHDQVEALSMSDRIAVFQQGKCQQIGTPMDIYNHPVNDFVAEFIGETNLYSAVLEDSHKDHERYQCKELEIPIKVDSQGKQERKKANTPLKISIRPEAVRVRNEKVEGPNCVTGKVKSIQFTGASIHTLIALPNGTFVKVTTLTGDNHTSLQMEADVFVQFPPNNIRIVPSTKEGSK